MSLRERLKSRLSERRAEDRAAEVSRQKRAARKVLEDTPAERPRTHHKEDDSLTSSASRVEVKSKMEEPDGFRGSARRSPEKDQTPKPNAAPEEQAARRPRPEVAESRSEKNTPQDPRGGRVSIAADTTAPRRRHWEDIARKQVTADKVPRGDAGAWQPAKQRRTESGVAQTRLPESTKVRHSALAQEEAGKGQRSADIRRGVATLRDAIPERARDRRSEPPVVHRVVPAIRVAERRAEAALERANDRRMQEESATATTARKDRAESFPGKQKVSHLEAHGEKTEAKREARSRAKDSAERASSTMRPRKEAPARRERNVPTKAIQITRAAKPSQIPQFRRLTVSASAQSGLADAATSTATTSDPLFDPTFTSIATPIGIYPPAAVPLPALNTQGAYVLTPNSVAVGLHGVNVVGFDTLQSTSNARASLGLDDVSLAVLHQLWHFNVVRLPFQAQTILQGTGALSAGDILTTLTEIVEAAAQGGLYILLAIEAVPGVPVAMPDATTIQALQTLAGNYSSNTAVLYEIFASVEPFASAWIENAPSLIAAIRSQSPAALVFVNSGNGGFDLTQLPLLSPTGEAIFGVVYTINLGGGFPAPDTNLLANLAGRCPVCATQWASDDGPISAYLADMLGRNGIHWIASDWNADPLLANDVAAHDYSATSWGMLAIRAALYPVRPFLLPVG